MQAQAPLCTCYQPAQQKVSKNGNSYFICPQRVKCQDSYALLNPQAQQQGNFQQTRGGGNFAPQSFAPKQPPRQLYDPYAFNHQEQGGNFPTPTGPPQLQILHRATDSLPVRGEEKALQELKQAVEQMNTSMQEQISLLKRYWEEQEK